MVLKVVVLTIGEKISSKSIAYSLLYHFSTKSYFVDCQITRNDIYLVNPFAWKCFLPFRQMNDVLGVNFSKRSHFGQDGFRVFIVVMLVFFEAMWFITFYQYT